MKELGAKDWMYLDAKDDGNLFLQMVDTVIAQKVDGVICCRPTRRFRRSRWRSSKRPASPFWPPMTR